MQSFAVIKHCYVIDYILLCDVLPDFKADFNQPWLFKKWSSVEVEFSIVKGFFLELFDGFLGLAYVKRCSLRFIVINWIAMSSYVLIEKSEDKFEVLRDGRLMWDVSFPRDWTLRYGFCAETSEGINYVLKNSGMFFWRKLLLYKNNDLAGVFRRNRCIEPFKDLYFDSRKFIYWNSERISFLEKSHEKEAGREVIYRWEMEGMEVEWAVTTLALVSIQNNAHISGVRY